MSKLIIVLVILLAGCTPYYAVSLMAHIEHYDKPEVTLENPLAEFEVGLTGKGNFDVFIRHTSGVFDTESGYGFNVVGVRYTNK